MKFTLQVTIKTSQLLLKINQISKSIFPNSPQVLGSVKNRIEAFAASHEDFPAMLKKAQQYLVARGKVDWTDSPAAVPPLRRSDSLGEDGNRRTCVYGVCLCCVCVVCQAD